MRLNPTFAAHVPKTSDAVDRPCILVVDDEPAITRSLAELLGRQNRVLIADSAERALELLQANDIAVILTDQRMPTGSGAELLARVLDIAPETTRILFTGYSDITAVIEAVNRGQIYQYIAKPWQPDELQAIVTQGLERYRLVHENRRLLGELRQANERLEARVRERTNKLREQNRALRRARREIEELSRRDPLTGLANRRWLDRVLRLEIDRSARYGLPLSVVMLDLDHFKSINDRFGHPTGDRVLQDTATALLAAVRANDLVGRLGGEEFLMVLPNTAVADAGAFAERLRTMLAESPSATAPEAVTASLGVAAWREGDSPDDLIERADTALYGAKQAGRNRVAIDAGPVDDEDQGVDRDG